MITYERLFIRHMQSSKVVLRLKNFLEKADEAGHLQLTIFIEIDNLYTSQEWP